MKLKKRLPESRSQKKERLAGERERRAADRELASKRRDLWLAQQDQSLAIWKEWRGAVKRRQESDAAYARFEEVHRRYWDFFRHAGMPDAEMTIAIQRWRDGLAFDAEPLVAWLEDGPHRRDGALLRLAKRLELTDDQRDRLRVAVLRVVDLPFWHREFREYARLARTLDDSAFRAELEVRVRYGGPGACRAAEVLRPFKS